MDERRRRKARSCTATGEGSRAVGRVVPSGWEEDNIGSGEGGLAKEGSSSYIQPLQSQCFAPQIRTPSYIENITAALGTTRIR